MYIHIYTCTYMYACINLESRSTHVNMHIYMCTYMYIHVHIFMYMYIYTYTSILRLAAHM